MAAGGEGPRRELYLLRGAWGRLAQKSADPSGPLRRGGRSGDSGRQASARWAPLMVRSTKVGECLLSAPTLASPFDQV